MSNPQTITNSSKWAGRMTSILTKMAIIGVSVIVLVSIGYILSAYWNAERLKDVQAITTALRQYAADHAGTYPPGLGVDGKQIGTTETGCAIMTAQCTNIQAEHCLDLSTALHPYLEKIPSDPVKGNAERTHYVVQVERGGGLLVTACHYSK